MLYISPRCITQCTGKHARRFTTRSATLNMRQSMTQNIIPRCQHFLQSAPKYAKYSKGQLFYSHFQCHTSYIPECHTYYATKYDEKCETEYKPYCKVPNYINILQWLLIIKNFQVIIVCVESFLFIIFTIARHITQRSTRPNIRRSVRFIMRKNAMGNVWINY